MELDELKSELARLGDGILYVPAWRGNRERYLRGEDSVVKFVIKPASYGLLRKFGRLGLLESELNRRLGGNPEHLGELFDAVDELQDRLSREVLRECVLKVEGVMHKGNPVGSIAELLELADSDPILGRELLPLFTELVSAAIDLSTLKEGDEKKLSSARATQPR